MSAARRALAVLPVAALAAAAVLDGQLARHGDLPRSVAELHRRYCPVDVGGRFRLEGGRVLVRPIAGTRARGADADEDACLARDLLADPKELAEHLMLLDLGRNDVGRVSVPGSVQVTELMSIERYSHVMHIVSNVTGILRDDLDPFDALTACFPAGTVSGAPKVRAMEIIDSLERTKRGPYAGVVGYFDFAGNVDTCITIRTIVATRGRAFVQAGAGVVADSDPAS
ncbi:MAG: anthranilate synthase component I family protein, partial [Actinobacteria bacterium]|nr:anthranilate synthase component I family protein [Actinomycetota bacterium]